MRLREERSDHPLGKATVREYVRLRKRELGIDGREVFVGQSYALGQEAQGDWSAEEPFTAPTPMPLSKRFWKDTSTGSITSKASSTRCDMTTCSRGEDPARIPARRNRAGNCLPLSLRFPK
jgi:hypothetical protein